MRADEIQKIVLQVIDGERRRNRELANNPHFDQGTTIAVAAPGTTVTITKADACAIGQALQAAMGGVE